MGGAVIHLRIPPVSTQPDLYHGKWVAGLFASGEQGVWYDPSDLTTMFQDAAGTVPVTAVGQPVGKILDKSGRGNHATQSTTTSLPTLSARVNLFDNTENFGTGGWGSVYGGITSVNQVVSPRGDLTADIYTESLTSSSEHIIYRNITAPAGVAFKLSCYYRKPSKSSRLVLLRFSAGSINSWAEAFFDLYTLQATFPASWCYSASITDVGGGWYRCEAVFKELPASVTVQVAVGFSGIYAGDGLSSVAIWGIDLRVANESANLPAYQRVNTSTDYDTVGFPYYLSFDGVDDYLSTGSINFTATDKMTVFAGVRKLSDARGIVVELNDGSTGSNRYFALNSAMTSVYSGAISPFHNYEIIVHGSVNQELGDFASFLTTNAFPSPNTSVLAGTLDIALKNINSAKLRVNAVIPERQSGQFTGNSISGKFPAAPLYIGRRGGASFPFNGRLYGLIVRGAATDDIHLTHAEKYLAYKSGVSL